MANVKKPSFADMAAAEHRTMKAERDRLRAELAEAVGLLRRWTKQTATEGTAVSRDTRAFLARTKDVDDG